MRNLGNVCNELCSVFKIAFVAKFPGLSSFRNHISLDLNAKTSPGNNVSWLKKCFLVENDVPGFDNFRVNTVSFRAFSFRINDIT